jgi:hypothetical protein
LIFSIFFSLEATERFITGDGLIFLFLSNALAPHVMRIACLAILVTAASAIVLPVSSYPTKPFSISLHTPEHSRNNELVQMVHVRRVVIGDDGESGGHRQIIGSETDKLLDAMINAPTKSRTQAEVAHDDLEALRNKHTTIIKSTLRRNPGLTVEEKAGLLRDTDKLFDKFLKPSEHNAIHGKGISLEEHFGLLDKVETEIIPSLEEIVFPEGW